MGSKRWMLRNGLGHLIQEEIKNATRFVDLFTGSGAVAQFAATAPHSIEVRAYDLQHFCVALANSVLTRASVLPAEAIWADWHRRAEVFLKSRGRYADASEVMLRKKQFTQAYVGEMRGACERAVEFNVTSAYGGHYFSLAQALWIDALRETLPMDGPAHAASLAALIQASSQCAASPGHTAQPFQPTKTAKKFLYASWERNVLDNTKAALFRLATLHARQVGGAKVEDANTATEELNEGDLVFLDPPYSGVHYSRFYHVLETVARGENQVVTGIGRYPAPAKRPWSRYSVKTESRPALDNLLKRTSEKGAKAILTFPEHDCSNGLSGEIVEDVASKYFKVRKKVVENKFSTMGGTKSTAGIGYGRAARQAANELIFILNPR